jgi:hypothetical protein
MSDVGNLSYEYEQAHNLEAKLKATLDVSLLLALVELLDPLNAPEAESPQVMNVPVGLARRLRSRDFEGEPISAALGRLASTMHKPQGTLSEADMRLLQEVNSETAREAATVFRRMVRR